MLRLIIIIILFPAFCFSQDAGIGYWKDYMSYTKATKVEVGINRTYCVTEGALYYFDHEDQSIKKKLKTHIK